MMEITKKNHWHKMGEDCDSSDEESKSHKIKLAKGKNKIGTVKLDKGCNLIGQVQIDDCCPVRVDIVNTSLSMDISANVIAQQGTSPWEVHVADDVPIKVDITNSPLIVDISGVSLLSQSFEGSFDAFGRLRISNPVTLFDSQHRYQENLKWSTDSSGTVQVDHIPNESSINLTSGGGESYVYRETKRVFPYQPGKSLLIYNSFVMNAPFASLSQRVGYFSKQNGVYFENDSFINNMVLLSNSVPLFDKIPQSDWNGDKCDGKGPSGFNLDTSKGNILWIDVEWLGVGNVRTGFVYNNKHIVAHTFYNTNNYFSAYMTTAALPIRYEISSPIDMGTFTLKQICSSVISEGGYEQRTEKWTATRTTGIVSTSSSVGWKPVVAIRLATGRTDSVVLPQQIHIIGAGNDTYYQCALIRNPNVVLDGSWIVHAPKMNVEYNTTATITIPDSSANEIIETAFFNGSNQAKMNISQDVSYNWDIQLGRDQSTPPNSDIILLAVRYLTASGPSPVVFGAISWNDLL
jgi:hypothetical protein